MIRTLKSLALAALAAATGASASTTTDSLDAGDVIVGFYTADGTGATQNLIVNLGSFQKFAANDGATLPLGPGLVADLAATFGADWNSRADLFWAVAGATYTASVDGLTRNSIFATSPRATAGASPTPIESNTDSALSSRRSQIQSIANIFNTTDTTANSSVSVVVPGAHPDSFWTRQQGTTTPQFGDANNNRASGTSVSDFYALVPTSGGIAPNGNATDSTGLVFARGGNYLGYFTLSSTGLTFTASGTATEQPAVAPAFTAQPASQTVTVGDSVTFTATVTGTPAPTLQWFKGTSALTGKTSATLTLSNVQLADAADYKLVATNSAAPGGVPSSVATLVVNPAAAAPSFSNVSASQSVIVGDTVTLSATVTGYPTPTLQWFKGTSALDGQTTDTLALTNVQLADAGDYSLRAINASAPAGLASATITLTVNEPAVAPTFTTDPASQSATVGDSVTFTATVTGTPAPTLQWFKGTSALTGKTSATLTLSNVQLADAGGYKLVATNSAAPSGVSSATATLSVTPALVAPVFTSSPLSQTVAYGSALTLTSAATGKPAPTFAWRKGTTTLTGQTTASLTLDPVSLADAGTYTVTAFNSSAPDGVSATAATITVIVPSPAPIVDPGTLKTGSVVTFALFDGAAVPAGLVFKAAGLPAGLALNPATGVISGTITAKPSTARVTTWAEVGKIKSAVQTATLTIGAFPAALTGTYEALLLGEDELSLPVGKVSVTVAANGGLSGTLTTNDLKTLPIKGGVALASNNASASAVLSLARGKLAAYSLSLTVAEAPALRATLALDGATLGSADDGARILDVAPSGTAGAYTALFSAPTNLGTVEDYPLGSGHATATINAKGALSLAGKNADGTKLTATLSLGADNTYRLYAKPYSTQIGGYLAGPLPLTRRADDVSRWHVSASSGSDVYWTKPDPTAATTNYADGFGPLALTVRIEPWSKFVKNTNPLPPLLGLGESGDFLLELSATGLVNETFGLPTQLNYSAANLVSVVGTNTPRLTIKINTANGSFTGGFSLAATPSSIARKVVISGALLQPAPADDAEMFGGGFFLLNAPAVGGPVRSGSVNFTAR